jgi:hypothetical protein
MVELTAIESTLGTWITQIRDDPSVTPEMMQELKFVNDEIVEMAKEVVAIDAGTHWRLDLIRQQAKDELRDVNSSLQMLTQYSGSMEQDQPHLDLEC